MKAFFIGKIWFYAINCFKLERRIKSVCLYKNASWSRSLSSLLSIDNWTHWQHFEKYYKEEIENHFLSKDLWILVKRYKWYDTFYARDKQNTTLFCALLQYVVWLNKKIYTKNNQTHQHWQWKNDAIDIENDNHRFLWQIKFCQN